MEIELTPTDSELSVEVSLERLSEELGEQGILGEDVDDPEFFYLAALSLECRDDDGYPVEDVVMEFLRNSAAVDLSPEDCDEIEAMLR